MQATGIRSLEKGLTLLSVIQCAGNPMRLGDIARAGGMTPSQAHGYLVSLVRAGFVVQSPETGQYDLGEAAFGLGMAALRRRDFLALARDAIARLNAELGETVTLSVWGETGPVVVDKLEGRHDSVYEIRVGGTVRLWPTATGRVFMAYLPEAKWETLLDASAENMSTPLPDGEDLAGLLTQTRKDGVATTRPATLPDFSAIAAPVLEQGGHLRGVLTVLGRASGFDIDPQGEPAEKIKAEAAALSVRLGHSPS